MRFRNIMLWMGALLAGAGAARARQVEQTSTPTVIRSETKLVLVDAVVTDKKGNYVTDLTQKDFDVLEDNKKQSIKTFSFEADPNSPLNNQKHYLVLFFDNASAGYGDQIQARQAAAKFIDGNTGPNKYIAIANFTGSLRITQNFTNDPERLKAVVSGVKMSTVSTADIFTPLTTAFRRSGSLVKFCVILRRKDVYGFHRRRWLGDGVGRWRLSEHEQRRGRFRRAFGAAGPEKPDRKSTRRARPQDRHHADRRLSAHQ